jgi:hypothetical protein
MSTECKKKFVIVVDPTLSKGEKGDPGQNGQNALFLLPLSTDDIDYRGDVLTSILDSLLYLALEIETFVATPSIYEKGQVLTTVFLNWTFNKAIESQSITGTGVTPPTLVIGDRNSNVALANISTNTVITLTADDVDADANPAKTATVTLQFLNKIYYGKATYPGAINSAFLNSTLPSKELASNRDKTFVVTTGAGEYIWFAIPVAYGAASFISNGFSGGFQLEATISHTNESGSTENYYVYRSVNTNLGLTSIQVY